MPTRPQRTRDVQPESSESAQVEIRHHTVVEEILGDGRGRRATEISRQASRRPPRRGIFVHVGRLRTPSASTGWSPSTRAATFLRTSGCARSCQACSPPGTYAVPPARRSAPQATARPRPSRLTGTWPSGRGESLAARRLVRDRPARAPGGPTGRSGRKKRASAFAPSRSTTATSDGRARHRPTRRAAAAPAVLRRRRRGGRSRLGVSRVKVGDRVATTVFQRWLDGDTLPPEAYSSVLAGGLDGVLADRVVLHEDGLVHVPEPEPRGGVDAPVRSRHGLARTGDERAGASRRHDPRTGHRRSLDLRAPVRPDGRSTRDRDLEQRCEAERVRGWAPGRPSTT